MPTYHKKIGAHILPFLSVAGFRRKRKFVGLSYSTQLEIRAAASKTVTRLRNQSSPRHAAASQPSP